MIKRIGIPRSLLFLEYMDFVISFFEGLGVEVVISDKTNKEILSNGAQVAVDDVCLPIKIFHGHVINLIGKVDAIFIPRIMSIYQGEHICPKFGGVPELIKYSIKNLPPIISGELDNYESYKQMAFTILEVSKPITDVKKRAYYAYDKAYRDYMKVSAMMKAGYLPIDGMISKKRIEKGKMHLLLLGHPYNLYDSYVNMSLFEKLESFNTSFTTPEMIEKGLLNEFSNKNEGRQYWTFYKKIIGLTYYGIDHLNFDGIIYISSFACGIDSVLIETVQRVARKENKPFLLLSIDEHTGEAGINTRLEAFIDMIERKKFDESDISTHGEDIYSFKGSARRA